MCAPHWSGWDGLSKHRTPSRGSDAAARRLRSPSCGFLAFLTVRAIVAVTFASLLVSGVVVVGALVVAALAVL